MKKFRRSAAPEQIRAQAAFAFAFLGGCLSIIALKVAGLPQFVVTSAPLAFMAAYASLVFVAPFSLRPDQAGDNVYYLGFLFTLTSLGYSLFAFSVDAGVEAIVQNFGIAIASTIAGVFGRIVLNQMRTDPYESERAARLDLADAARALRAELDDSVVEFSAHRRQVQQSAADGMRELQGIAAQQMQEGAQRMQDMVGGTVGRVEAVVSRWTDQAEIFNRRSVEMADAMSSLGERLELVRAPAEMIEEKIAPASDAVTRLGSAAEQAATNMGAASQRMEDGASKLANLVLAAEEIVAAARQQSSSLGQAASVLEDARAQLEAVRMTGEKLDAGYGATTSKLSDALLHFLAQLERQLSEERAHRAQVAAEGAAKLSEGLGEMAARVEGLEAEVGREREVLVHEVEVRLIELARVLERVDGRLSQDWVELRESDHRRSETIAGSSVLGEAAHSAPPAAAPEDATLSNWGRVNAT